MNRAHKYKQTCPPTLAERKRTPGCAIVNVDIPEEIKNNSSQFVSERNVPERNELNTFNQFQYTPFVSVNDKYELNTNHFTFSRSFQSTRNILENVHKFASENPKMSAKERVLAQMSAATYIHNPDELKFYIENVSDIAKAGYKLNETLTNESKSLMLVFEKNGKPTLAFRGTEHWGGIKSGTQDGLHNLFNTTGITRAGQYIKKKTSVENPLTQDQNTLDRMLQKVYDHYQQVPEDFTGHSLGGARSKFARLWFRENHKNEFTSLQDHKITAFMPAPGGGSLIHANDNAYKFFATEAFDPVAAIDRLQMSLANKNIGTIFRSSHGYGILGSHDIRNAAGEMTPNVGEIQFSNEEVPGQRQVDLPRNDISFNPNEQFELRPPVLTEHLNTTFKAVRAEAPNAIKNIGTGLLTSEIVSQTGIDEGSQTGVLVSSAVNTGLDATVAAGEALVTGTGLSAAGAAAGTTLMTTALPTLAAYEAATSVGSALDNLLSTSNLSEGQRRAISGGGAGFSAAAAALTTSAATDVTLGLGTAAFRMASGYALVAAEEGAAIGLGEVAAGLALAPIPGARIAALGLGAATLIGAGLGWLFSHHDTPEEIQRKAEENQHHLEVVYNGLAEKFYAKANQVSFDLNKFQNNIITAHDAGLSDNEIHFLMEHSDNKFFETYESNVRRVYNHQNEINNRTNEIRNLMASEDFQLSSLSQDQRDFLQMYHTDFYTEISQTETITETENETETETGNGNEN